MSGTAVVAEHELGGRGIAAVPSIHSRMFYIENQRPKAFDALKGRLGPTATPRVSAPL